MAGKFKAGRGIKRVKLFQSTIQAWHTAFATTEGVQDPFTPKISGSARGGGMRDVRELESAKVLKVINALSAEIRHAGMFCFCPKDSKVEIQARDKLCDQLWQKFLSFDPENPRLSYWQTVRMTILITAVLEEGRAQANGHSVLSDASVASRMGIDKSTFSRTWADSYRALVAYMSESARAALAEVEPIVNQLNDVYQEAV